MTKWLYLIIGFTLILAACTPAAQSNSMMEKPADVMDSEKEAPDEAMMDSATDTMDKTSDDMDKADDMAKSGDMDKADDMDKSDSMDDNHGDDAMADTGGSMQEGMAEDAKMMETPAWFAASLTDVRSGDTFTIDDLKGKVVLVETLAMWCSSCKRQQMEVKSLHEALGEMGSDLVSIGLDIDPNENAADLKEYTEANGFDWTYVVAPAAVSREIGQLYGDQFLNPPSTPILIIDRKGQVHPMPFGIKSAEDLKQFLSPFLTESM